MKFIIPLLLFFTLLFDCNANNFASEYPVSLQVPQFFSTIDPILKPSDIVFFNPLPEFNYANSKQENTKGVHPALRFFIIGIGTFPLVYLITYPILIAATGSWSQNKQITTSLAITGGISITVSLIDFFLGFRTKSTYGYERI